jgi:hypothetical protein
MPCKLPVQGPHWQPERELACQKVASTSAAHVMSLPYISLELVQEVATCGWQGQISSKKTRLAQKSSRLSTLPCAGENLLTWDLLLLAARWKNHSI